MKKFFAMAAVLAFCSAGSVMAQSEVSKTTKPASSASHKEASCCSKNSASKASCGDSKEHADKDAKADTKSSAGKSSCCMKGGHTEAKAEVPADKDKKD